MVALQPHAPGIGQKWEDDVVEEHGGESQQPES